MKLKITLFSLALGAVSLANASIDELITNFGNVIKNKTGQITSQEKEAMQKIIDFDWTSLGSRSAYEVYQKLCDHLAAPTFYQRKGALELITALVENSSLPKTSSWDWNMGAPLLLVALKVDSTAASPGAPVILNLLNALINRGADIFMVNMASPSGSPIHALNAFADKKSPLRLLVERAQATKSDELYNIATHMVRKAKGSGHFEETLTAVFKLMDLSIITPAALALAQAFVEQGVDEALIKPGEFRKELEKTMLKTSQIMLERANFEGRLKELETAVLAPTLDMKWIGRTAQRLYAFGKEAIKNKGQQYIDKVNERLVKIVANPKLLEHSEVWKIATGFISSGLITAINVMVDVKGEQKQLLPLLVERTIKATKEEKKENDEALRALFIYTTLVNADITAMVETEQGKEIPIYEYFGQEAVRSSPDQYAFRPLVQTLTNQKSPLYLARNKQDVAHNVEGVKPFASDWKPHPEILTGMLKAMAETVDKEMEGKASQEVVKLAAGLVDYGANSKVIPAGTFRKAVQKEVQKKIDGNDSARQGLENFIDTTVIKKTLDPLPDKPTHLDTLVQTINKIEKFLKEGNLKEAQPFIEDLGYFGNNSEPEAQKSEKNLIAILTDKSLIADPTLSSKVAGEIMPSLIDRGLLTPSAAQVITQKVSSSAKNNPIGKTKEVIKKKTDKRLIVHLVSLAEGLRAIKEGNLK